MIASLSKPNSLPLSPLISSPFSPAHLPLPGASTGIGQHAALELARKNYTVLAGVRRREDENALKALNEPRLLPVTLDVTKPRDVQRAFDMAKKEVDKGLPFVALINNAGLAKVRVPTHTRHYVLSTTAFPPPDLLIKERLRAERISSCVLL